MLNSYNLKAMLRDAYRERRRDFVRSLSPSEHRTAFAEPPQALLRLFTSERVVAAYVARGSEADPMSLLAIAQQRGCRTALVAMDSRDSPLEFRQWSIGDPLVANDLSIEQPPPSHALLEPDIIIVPLLAYAIRSKTFAPTQPQPQATQGYARLGQGGGHYDRALALRPNALTIGLAWSIQEIPILPQENHDIPLAAVLTEKAYLPPIGS